MGPFLMLGSAFMFAVLDVLIKLIGPEFGVWDIAFYRWGGGFVLLLIIFGWRENPIRTFNMKLMIIRSISGCIAFLCLITAIRLIPLSTAMILFYCYPAFAAVFSYLIYDERISKVEILCVIGTLCGVTILLGIKPGGNLFGHIIGWFGGVFAGLTVCLIKKLREKDGPVVIYLYFCMLGTIISLPAIIANPKLPESGIEWLMVVGIACSAIVAQLLMNQGFQHCKSWEGGLFLTSEIIYTTIFGICFLGELTTRRFWVGGMLIIGSVVFLHQMKIRRNSHHITNIT
jgi:drug/metabolite transporter (DMT)-like permease